MTNKEFLLEVQKSCHIEMPRCLMLMGSLQKMLGSAAVDQIPVSLAGLGVFTSHKHPEYEQENPSGIMTLYPPRISYRMQSEQSAEGTPCEELLAEYAHVELDEAAAFVAAFVTTVNAHLQAGEKIEVPGIGTFNQVLTHQSDLQHVDFLPCDQMKDLVNAPFACFEPYEIVTGCPLEEKVTAEPEEIQPVVEETPEPEEETPEMAETAKEDLKKPDEIPSAIESSVPNEVPEPEISIHKDGHIMIKEPRKSSDDKSYRRILYISLSLIMVGCAFLLWLMFGNDTRLYDDPPTEAKVVEAKPSKKTPVSTVPAKVEKTVEVKQEEKVEETKTPEIANKEQKTNIKESQVKADSSQKAEPAKSEIVKNEPTKPTTVEPEPAKPVKEVAKVFHRMKGADGKEVKVTLQAGSRLTLIALEHFGDKAFWPYVFEVNTDKLKAPNLVQSGMVLYLPDPDYYGIDSKDPESVKKAKNRAAQLLK